MARWLESGEYSTQVGLAAVAAATATGTYNLFIAPRPCKVRGVYVTSDVAVTGDNTNTKNLNVLNRGADGTGTTEVGNLDLVTGTNMAAGDRVEVPLNATYSTNGVTLAEGDVLALAVEKVGTGVLVGPSVVQVKWETL